VGTTQLRLGRPHQTEIAPGTKHQDTIAALGRALFAINTLDFESGMEAYIVIRTGASHLMEDAVAQRELSRISILQRDEEERYKTIRKNKNKDPQGQGIESS
jgi:hypothetical protein